MKGLSISIIAITTMLLVSCQRDTSKSTTHEIAKCSKEEIIVQKNFPFVDLILSNKNLHHWLLENEYMHQMLEQKLQVFKRGLDIENKMAFNGVNDVTGMFLFTENEIVASQGEWKKYSEISGINDILDSLRSTNQFYIYNELDDEIFIQTVWKHELEGINKLIKVYGAGEKPMYAAIDSLSYNVSSEYFKKLINMTALNVLDGMSDSVSFFKPSLDFALWMLKINNRDEAARFEPMESGENFAAVQQMPGINWDIYPYSVIMVPGYGPEVEGVALSPMGMLRCKLAADRYYEGMAPFIIVSGGYVHPFQTPFCEAIEMKKELMNRYNIPESALIIEPHARHTTTNFRNAARLIFKYKIPEEKKALFTTTLDQSYYITNMNFDKRCMDELGYLPYRLGERLNRNDIEFYPLPESCTIDCSDPLDP